MYMYTFLFSDRESNPKISEQFSGLKRRLADVSQEVRTTLRNLQPLWVHHVDICLIYTTILALAYSRLNNYLHLFIVSFGRNGSLYQRSAITVSSAKNWKFTLELQIPCLLKHNKKLWHHQNPTWKLRLDSRFARNTKISAFLTEAFTTFFF